MQFGLVSTNMTFFTAYSYIYYKYCQTRRQDASQRSFYENRKAKFFTPFLVCFSFFVSGTVPLLINSVGVNVDANIMILGSFLDGICNSLVYVFLNERFVSWFRRWKTIIVFLKTLHNQIGWTKIIIINNQSLTLCAFEWISSYWVKTYQCVFRTFFM